MSFRSRGRGMGNGRFSGGRDTDGGRGGGRLGMMRDGGGPRGGGGVSNHTSDASMAGARIFVGNLPTSDSRLTKELLEDSFGQFGRILGISILKGFGFIQYTEEASAENAIHGGQNIEILAHRIDVKPARQGAGKDGALSGGGGAPEPGNFRERSPLRRRDSFDMPPGPRGREPEPTPMGRDMMMRGGGGGPHRDMIEHGGRDFDGRPQERDWTSRDHQRDLDPYPVDPYMERERSDIRPLDPYLPPVPDHRGSFAGPPAPHGGIPVANEVEIVVTSKSGPMRQFAERIESRIRSQGLIVDVLHPHEDIPLRQILTDLAARGTLFGVVLTPQNLEYSSLTLSILFGQPEEHRNMPVEDAFDLLASSYRAYQQQQAKGVSAGRAVEPAAEPRATLGRSLVTDVHPTNIQVLINALQENRPLSVLEYDRVIRYLSERRDRQAAEEPRGLAGTTSQPPYQSAATGQDPQELQQRILSILSSSGGALGAGGVGPAPVPVPAPWNAGAEVSSTGQQQQRPVDDQSNVQKALDSLIQTGPNLLKHYQSAGPGGNPRQPQGQDPHRPMQQPPQQPGNYYAMGKRF